VTTGNSGRKGVSKERKKNCQENKERNREKEKGEK
jgi:hypothetical protein